MHDIQGDPHEESRRLRQTVNDLVTLSKLPAEWTGLNPDGISESLAEMLSRTLDLELVYVRLQGASDEALVEIVRSKHGFDTTTKQVALDAMRATPAAFGAETSGIMPDPLSEGMLRVAINRFGVEAGAGTIVAASQSADFPSERERLLLDVATTQTATIIQRVHAEAQVRDSQNQFFQLGNAISHLAWMAQPDGYIDWYNDRWYEYTGTTFEQAGGWGWECVHHPDVFEEVTAAWQQSIALKRPFEMTFPLLGSDGKFRPFLTRVVPFHDAEGNIIRWFGTNTDISAQEQAKEELQALADRLSEADQRKDEFLAILAHELRNPLAPIRTGLELIDLARNDPDKIEEVRSMMERQTQQLIALVDDLLDISRITRGKLELRTRRVDIATVVRNVVESTYPLLQETQHQLSVSLPDQPVYLKADPNRLAQVLSNLLTNSAKYSPSGSSVQLNAEPIDNGLLISVSDQGLGIPAAMRERIFDMFTQIDRPQEKGQAGLGIGLALVKSIVELHGGLVDVHSEGPGSGSNFRVWLPVVAKPPMQAEETSRSHRKRGEEDSCKVLIVDDNRAAATTLAMIVKLLGHEVREAYDGQEGVESADAFRPDVILMDIGMPRMNGYQATLQIREQAWGKSVKIVALTGWGQEEDKRKGKEAGFDLHLVKPVDVNTIREVLSSTHADKSAR